MLEVEFLPSTLPPQLESTTPSEDWVSDISLAVRGCVPNVLLSGRRRSPAARISCAISVTHALVFCLLAHNRAVLTASYAGTLSLQHNDLPPPSTLTFAGHDLSVLSTCYVPHPLGSEDKRWIASGGMDRVGRVWEYSVSKPPRGFRSSSAENSRPLLSGTDPASVFDGATRGAGADHFVHPLSPPSSDLVCPFATLAGCPYHCDLGTASAHGRLGRLDRSLGSHTRCERRRRRLGRRGPQEEAEKAVDDRCQQGQSSDDLFFYMTAGSDQRVLLSHRLRWRPCVGTLAKSRGRFLTVRMSPRRTRRVGITRSGVGTSRLGPRSTAR